MFAKRLIIHLNIKDLQSELISKLNAVFNSNKGDHSVTFEVMELEKIKKQIEIEAPIVVLEEVAFDENLEITNLSEQEIVIPTEVEETKIITRLSMPSRKLKITISGELLNELEKMQINFKLN